MLVSCAHVVDPKPAKLVEPPTKYCRIRLVAKAVQLDGEWMKPAQAVAVCKSRARAIVELTETADLMMWERMRPELEAAHVVIVIREARTRDASTGASFKLGSC